jgi:hypothetical protein
LQRAFCNAHLATRISPATRILQRASSNERCSGE